MSASTTRSTRVPPTAVTKRQWAWRAAAVAAGATVIFSAGAWADGSTAAKAGAPADPAVGEHCPHAGGPGGHAHPGKGGEMRGPMAAPGMMPMVGPHLDRMLDEVKATDAQRKQIRAIADKARGDLQALHEEGRKLHEQGLKLWSAAKIDDKAIEANRQQSLALHDRVSQRFSQAMLEAGKVLQPEQRLALAQHMQERASRFEHMKAHWRERMGGAPRPAPGASGVAASSAS
ncbi:MAG: hypothetical protein RI907_1196 [Pseudomonadota bacterium]|jgi:Spy/CpxP family protein refolding chaperone